MSKWDVVQLSDIASVMTYGDWIESKDQSPDGIRLLQVGNIGKGHYINKADRAKYISKETFVKLKCTEVFDGDVLVSRLPDPIGRACIVPKLDTKLITAVDCTIIRTLDKKCCTRYLIHFLCSPRYFWQIEKFIVGSTRSRISRTNLQSIFIPLPPLPIQQKLADILDQTNALIEKRKAQIAKLDLLVKSRFIEMFGSGLGKDTVELKDVCSIITDGTHQSPKFTKSGIPFLLVSNIVDNKLTYETKKLISREEYETLTKRTPVEVGDLLLTIVGSYGNPAIVKTTQEFCFQRHIAYIKPKHDIIDSMYLHAAFLSNAIKRQIEVKVKGVAQKTLNLFELKTIKINLPPLPLQNRFAEFVQAVDKTKFEIQSSLNKLELLYKSLMQQYFC